jgi:hypothetical protein
MATSPRLSFASLPSALPSYAPSAAAGAWPAVDTRLFVTSSASGALDTPTLPVTPGRPKLREILAEAAAAAAADGEHEAAVVFCGPPAMGADLRAECRRQSHGDFVFLMHEESFEL